MSNYLDRPIGHDSVSSLAPEKRYRDLSDVIGSVETAPNGTNTVLRVGYMDVGRVGWVVGKAHVVLTPEERDHLIDALNRQRDEQNAATAAAAPDPAEQTFEERVAAVRGRARYMGVNTIDLTDLFTVEVGGQDEDVVITRETADHLHDQLGALLDKTCAHL